MSKNDRRSEMSECIENFKRRHALPPLPGLAGSAKFFNRLVSARKAQDLVFITKAVAKNR